MTKLNPTELAEQHKKEQIKARNREYQKLYYKLRKSRRRYLRRRRKKKRARKSHYQMIMNWNVVLLRGTTRNDANISENITSRIGSWRKNPPKRSNVRLMHNFELIFGSPYLHLTLLLKYDRVAVQIACERGMAFELRFSLLFGWMTCELWVNVNDWWTETLFS